MCDVLQVRQNRVFLPIYTLRRGEQIIVLVGMSHFASKEFFLDIEKKLLAHERQGFKVLYEAVGEIPTRTWWSDWILRWKCIRQVRTVTIKLEEQFGLAYQVRHLRPRKSWIHSDFTASLWRRLEPGFCYSSDFLEKYVDLAQHPEKLAAGFLEMFKKMEQEVPPSLIIRDRRDTFAVSKILENVTTHDVITYWGVTHLPGMIRHLSQAGFVISNTEYVLAVDLSTIKTERV